MLGTVIITVFHDGLSNLDNGLDAALCTDCMVVDGNESLVIMSRTMCGKLKLCSYWGFLLNHIYRAKLKGSFETPASECECIVKHFILKYSGIPDLNMMSDTMDYSFWWDFIFFKNPKTFIQKFQDILTLPTNTTKDTWFSLSFFCCC